MFRTRTTLQSVRTLRGIREKNKNAKQIGNKNAARNFHEGHYLKRRGGRGPGQRQRRKENENGNMRENKNRRKRESESERDKKT